MTVLTLIYFFIRTAAILLVVAGVSLVVLRAIFDYANVNPFTWHFRNVRRATEPVLLPARAILRGFRLDPRVAPFMVVILMMVAGYLAVQIAGTILNTIAGILYATTGHHGNIPAGILGYLLFGFLGLYTLVIFVRIIFSWGGASYGSRLMRFLVRSTEPLLGPLRRLIPTVGMFDISPLIAFFIVWICQTVVASTLLRDWPLQFF
jgi:YggT family protein